MLGLTLRLLKSYQSSLIIEFKKPPTGGFFYEKLLHS